MLSTPSWKVFLQTPSHWRAYLPQHGILPGIAECAIRQTIWECLDEQDLLGDNMQAMSSLLREGHLLMGNSGMASCTDGWSRSCLPIISPQRKILVVLSYVHQDGNMIRLKARVRTRRLRASSLSACDWRWALCACWRAREQSIISVGPSLFMSEMSCVFGSSVNWI